MAKRKRPKYGNPARQADSAQELTRVQFLTPDEAGQVLDAPSGINQLARRSCDECGSPVEWLTGTEAQERGLDLAGGLEFLGLSDLPGKDVWSCTNCDNFGDHGPS